MLYHSDLTYRIAGRTLLDRASLSIPAGHRVGLVGPNGTGKSTLFKLISGELHADGGEITLIKGASMGMVRQDLPEDDTTLIDVVLAADTERAAVRGSGNRHRPRPHRLYLYAPRRDRRLRRPCPRRHDSGRSRV